MTKKLTLSVITLIFIVFFALPIIHFAIRKIGEIRPSSESAAEPIIRGIVRTLRFSVLQAALSAGLSIVIALPGAYAVSHFTFPLRRFFQSLTLVPFVLPSIIVIICMISFYGRSGFLNTILGTKINLIYNYGGILIAHVFFNFALALRIIGDSWSRIGPEYHDLAQNLGDTNAKAFLRVTLPLLLPSITSAFVLIFIYCFMSFGIVLVFGGIRFATFEVRIYQELYQKLDFARGAAYALVQIVISVVFIAASRNLGNRGAASRHVSAVRQLVPIRFASNATKLGVGLYWTSIALFFLGPMVAMLARSFSGPNGPSLVAYRALFSPGLTTRNVESLIRGTVISVILRSTAIALLSGTLTFVLAVAAALSLRKERGNLWRGLFQLPIGMTAIGLAAGLRLLFGNGIPAPVLVVLGQFFLAFPLVFRIVDTVVGNLHQSLIECAESLGARPWNVLWSVHIPVLRRGLVNAFAFSVALVFADFTIVLGVGRGEIVTFPVAIFRLIGFRSFDLALSLSGLYVFFCLCLFLLIDLTSRDDVVGGGVN